MEAGRKRIDLGGGFGAYAHNLGYAVYSPHGFKVGDRKMLQGAYDLAWRTLQRAAAKAR